MLSQYHKNLCNTLALFRVQSNFSDLRSKSSKYMKGILTSVAGEMSNAQSSKNIVIQVIGSGAHGAPASALLTGTNFRVLLNCGEGTQRLINEYKIKWNLNASHVFVTNSNWKNVGGLMGMALSLQSSKKSEMIVHGPELIENMFSATNRFVDLRSLSVKFLNSKTDTKYFDNSFEVHYVPLYSSTEKKLKQNISDSKLVTAATSCASESSHSEDDDCSDHSKHNNHNSKKKKRSHSQVCKVKNQVTVHYAMAYIFSVKSAYRLLIEKCVDFKVPVGPLLQKLKNGEDVTLENGNVVKSSDVVEQVSPRNVVVVVECPSENYLDSLLQDPAFFKHQSGDSEDIASAVIHFTSSDIVETSKYKDWINRFPKETKHVFINESNTCLGSIAIHRLQYKLHAIHPEIFPLLPTGEIPIFPRKLDKNLDSDHVVVETENDTKPQPQSSDLLDISSKAIFLDKICYKCKNNSFIKGETLCEVYVRPKLDYDYSRSMVLKPHIFIGEIEAVEGLLDRLKQLKSELQSSKYEQMKAGDQEYPQIIFLGTGCSQPSIFRNPSGILVFLDSENCMLLDCGEGTYNQLIRFFGREKAREVLKKLNLIFISHLHADHHIGLIKCLKERKAVFDEEAAASQQDQATTYHPVDLLAPVHLIRWLNFFSSHFEDISHLYSVIFTNKLSENEFPRNKFHSILNALNLKEIKTAKMDHCSSSYGVSFTHNNNWKLTYSGDTRPCNRLVEIGMNSDILIHEATFDDSLLALAKSKSHSTISEAIDIGKRMNAKFILLTHFSQRYSHLPLLDNYSHEGIGVAFDNMMVSLNQLPILPKLLPAAKLLLSKYYDLMVEKREMTSMKRKLVAEQQSSKKAKILV